MMFKIEYILNSHRYMRPLYQTIYMFGNIDGVISRFKFTKGNKYSIVNIEAVE